MSGDMEKDVSKKSEKFIRKNKNLLFEKFANRNLYTPDDFPVTVFMAGSPGAGKTEFSRALVDTFKNKAVRVDADEVRNMFEDYTGDNSHLFQNAVSIGVDELYQYCLSNNFNVVVDGTFAHKRTIENIQKSLNKNRKVVIYFIYQEPTIAWDFTRKREIVEHRKITKEVFIRTFFQSKKNIKLAKKEFGDKIKLNLVIKDLNNDKVSDLRINIDDVDSYINKPYNEDELELILK